MTDLSAAAGELYGLPASDFTAARDRLSADVRKAGDRELAAAIKKLRRPTTTAWYANQLLRQRGDQVAELLDTGVALRRAQADLDVDELRRQTQEGQRMVTELGREARRLAGDAGQSLSDETVREIEETLHAGLVDPAASDAIRSGHLTTALHYSGFGLFEATETGATASPATPPPAPAAPPKDTRRRPTGPEVEAARQARQDAEVELGAARRQAGEAGRRVEQARKRQDVLRQRIRRLDEELEQLRAEEAEASDAIAAAARDRRAAEDRVAQAEEALDRLAPP
jgi:chromosome segregation ATPase